MDRWRRLKSASEWGFFYGVITWLLATGITNKMPAIGVWAIILSRVIIGVLISEVRLDHLWWLRGAAVGAGVNLVFWIFSCISAEWIAKVFFAWRMGFWLMMISGVFIGLIIEITIQRRKEQVEE